MRLFEMIMSIGFLEAFLRRVTLRLVVAFLRAFFFLLAAMFVSMVETFRFGESLEILDF